MELNFSERQRATVAAAVTILGAAVICWAAWQICALLGRFVVTFSGVFLPLATAAILAVLLRPFYVRILARARYPALAVLLVYLAVLLPLGALLWLFGSLLADQLTGLISGIPHLLDRVQLTVQQRMPRLLQFWHEHEIGSRLREWAGANGRAILLGLTTVGGGAWAAGEALFRAIGGFFGWAVLPVYLAYFLMAPPLRWESVAGQLPFLKAETREDVLYLAREFVVILVAFFRGQILCAGAQGLMYAIAFGLAGVPYGVAIGLLMGVLNVVPYLGTIVGVALALPLAWGGGGWSGVLAAGAAFAVVQAVESYLVTPRIMGERTGLHPLAIMVALFFWGAALGGVMGLLLAIPLTAFFVVVWRLLKAKYLRALV